MSHDGDMVCIHVEICVIEINEMWALSITYNMDTHLLLVKDTKLMFLRHIRSALCLEDATQKLND